MLKEMKAAGFSKKVIEKARGYAPVATERFSKGGDGNGEWLWALR